MMTELEAPRPTKEEDLCRCSGYKTVSCMSRLSLLYLLLVGSRGHCGSRLGLEGGQDTRHDQH